jgi:hypothetical protein
MYMWYQALTIINLSITNFVLLLQRCPIWTLAVFIGYDFLIGWFSSTKTRNGKVNDCKWWSPCFVRVSTFVCQLEYNLYKWWWAGVNWVLGFSCLSSRWEILQLYQDYLVYFVTNARTDIVNNQVIPNGLGYISGNLN